MSEIIQAIVLGIVQGATEFIPVSSSGHLVIVPWLLGWPAPSLLFDTMLHWGTLLSIVLVFWRELWAIFVATLRSLVRRSLADPNARLGWFIVIGSIPAALIGLLFLDFFESLFHSPLAAGYFLFVTAGVLSLSELIARRRAIGEDLTRLSLGQATSIGLAQAVALAPGISRSGSTMAVGLAGGLRRDEAARFSFLLGTPAFFGAGLLQLIDALSTDAAEVASQAPLLIIGFVVSALAGYLAIRGLLAYLRRHSLYVFAVYCVALGSVVVGLHLF
ncbi:MAG: undecaprenyl-diphosphatase UppP [Caldilineaceae bacterium]|nr:undecaprenyl-diphosphatase UppP [Caldilineaceae bacterium]RIK33125.1 MAG: undecaprenyl-diphosphatase UppP [Chloroflexota bacterium]